MNSPNFPRSFQGIVETWKGGLSTVHARLKGVDVENWSARGMEAYAPASI
jgi:hypothetical protein